MSERLTKAEILNCARLMARACRESGMSANAIVEMVEAIDQREDRTANCGHCTRGEQEITLAGDAVRHFRPCPHCRPEHGGS